MHLHASAARAAAPPRLSWTRQGDRSMIALDWGLSGFRAFRLDAAGAVVAQLSAPAGILTIADGGFEAVLAAHLGGWLADAPIVAAGMIGSRQGWVEAPYVPCPAGIAELAARLVRHRTARAGDVWFVPGARWSDDRTIDVMRGEETQIVGALASRALDRAVLCLPGTHSKWATVAAGRIVDFRTYMTGELYALLRRHSILGRLMPDDPAADQDDDTVFAQGLARAEAPGGLLHHLFSARTAGLFERIAAPALACYLSGLVIGDEIASALAVVPRDAPILLVGAAALCQRYAQALARRGVTADVLPEAVVARGLHAIACAAGLLEDAP
jgi:2-dehydro-3-deoxygalactonokinase